MKKINSYLSKSCILSLLFCLQNAFAGNFNIIPLAAVPLPTTVTPGQTVVAYFNVTNMNSSASLNGYKVEGLPNTVIQNSTAPNYYTSGALCSNPVNLSPGASCLLQLDITGPVSSYFALCKGNSCTRSSAPLSVSTTPAPSTPTFAYITQSSNTAPVLVCQVKQSTGLLENCGSAGNASLLSTHSLRGIQIGNGGATAYINSSTGPLYQCPVYANTGMFGACTESTITSPAGYSPDYGFFDLNAGSTVAYLNDSSTPRVLACPIISNTIQSVCTNTGATNLSSGPTGITLNNANTISYIGSYGNYITTCAVNGNAFSACGQKTGDGVITFAEAIDPVLNNTGTILYITDNDTGDVYGCNVSSLNTTASTFSSCFVATSIYPQPWAIAINQENTFAYVTDYNNTVSVCPILSGGTFSTCTPNSSFSTPIDIALFY